MTQATKWILILTPSAQRDSGGEIIKKVCHVLEKSGIGYMTMCTDYPGHARDIASASWEHGYRRFLAVGGDGTLHEVLNGIMSRGTDTSDAILGQIPLGTGNDWFRSMGIKHGAMGTLDMILSSSFQPHDVGKTVFLDPETGLQKGCHYFLSGTAIGFDAVVADVTNRESRQRPIGRFRYLVNVFKCFGRYKPPEMTVEFDDNGLLKDRLFSVSAGNTRFTGGGMRVTPNAEHDNGCLDLAVIRNLSFLDVMTSFPLLYTSRIDLHPKISLLRCKTARITTNPPVRVHLDGEIKGNSPVEISVIHHGINVVAPA